MNAIVVNKLQEIVSNKFEGKTVIKSKDIIFSETPGCCIQSNMFFIIVQKNKVIKIKTKNVELLIGEIFDKLKSVSLTDKPVLLSEELDELLKKHNFTYSKDKFQVAMNALLGDKIIENNIFGFDVSGNCVVVKKMWQNSNTNNSKSADVVKIEIFSKRNMPYVKMVELGSIDTSSLNKNKFKEEDGCIVCNYKNYLSLEVKDVILTDNSISDIYRVVSADSEDYVCKITKAMEAKINSKEVSVEKVHIK